MTKKITFKKEEIYRAETERFSMELEFKSNDKREIHVFDKQNNQKIFLSGSYAEINEIVKMYQFLMKSMNYSEEEAPRCTKCGCSNTERYSSGKTCVCHGCGADFED